jgi:Na+/proline symporter
MNTSIVAFVIVLALSGAGAAVRNCKTPEDYLIASRSIQPRLSALSTVSINNCGFMFIGMIGCTYRCGIRAGIRTDAAQPFAVIGAFAAPACCGTILNMANEPAYCLLRL